MNLWRLTTWLVCAFVVVGTAWHIIVSRQPPAWDDAWYLELSFRLFHALRESPGAFVREYVSAFRIKAPLISLAPLPLYVALGAGERVALWTNLAFLAAIWLSIQRLGRRLYGPQAAWAAAAAAALIPLHYGLARIYMVELLLSALVALFLWTLLEARPERRAWGFILGALFGLGLLAKSLFPLYVAGPLWLRRHSLAPLARPALWTAAAIASTWYVSNAVYVVGFGLSAGFGAIARDYGESPFSAAALGRFGGSLGGDALSWPYVAALALLGAAAWYGSPRGWRPGAPERFLAAWAGPPLLVLLLGVNRDVRYLAPVLPAFALAAGALAAGSASARKGWLLVPALALPLAMFCAQTFGRPPAAALEYNGPPQSDPGWDRAGLLDMVAAHAPDARVVAVAFEHRFLNANNLSSLAAERAWPLRFISLGYRERTPDESLIRLKDKQADHLVLISGDIPPDLPAFLNRSNAGIAERVANGRLPARRVSAIPVTPRLTATLYRLGRGS